MGAKCESPVGRCLKHMIFNRKTIRKWWFNGIYDRYMDMPSGFIKHSYWKIPPSMQVLIGKSLISGPFSIAMFDYLRVNIS